MALQRVKGNLTEAIVRQFARPTGPAGRVVGWIMAHRSSNVKRNEWVVELLDLPPDSLVLEVGFGPGVAIAALARAVPNGRVYGIDHSPVMLRQATQRNAAAVRSGRVHVIVAPIDRLPVFDEPLDAILAVNTVRFWDEPVKQLAELRTRLRAGGRIAVATQPRGPSATEETSEAVARDTTILLGSAGFVAPRVETLELTPPVVCVIGTAP